MKCFLQLFETHLFDHCLALANILYWEMHQMDEKTAFLQGDLTEELYMKPPKGCRSKENPDHVCKLKKSLCALKQSARCWDSTLDSFLKSSGYKQVGADSCLYMNSVKLQNGKINFVILSIHVDDILWFSNDMAGFEKDIKARCMIS
jgi:hypothetical protein